MMEEKLDVLNERGEFTGEIATREECHKKGLWHRCVYAFVIDKNSNILLQKRSANKKLWPNLWDVTVGGHVLAGEFGRQALIRECKEELGIDINDNDIKYLVGSCSANKKGDIMAHKTFISYKWSEAQQLRDDIIDALGEDASYYKGETSDSPDLTDTTTDNIKKNLRNMMYYDIHLWKQL